MALVVFTGGARSGKSSAGQQLALSRSLDGARVTVAVFGRASADAEFADRVADHQSSRPEDWNLVEALDSRLWVGDVPESDLLLLDCLGTWMGLAMEQAFDASATGGLGSSDSEALPVGFAEEFTARTEPIITWLLDRQGDTIVVTNEVGDGVVPAFASGRFFRDELARANRRLVTVADAAHLVVCGRLLELSALPVSAKWPVD